jgi:hypothetical protein
MLTDIRAERCAVRPEATGPLFAGAAWIPGCWAPALPVFNDKRTLRIGAYGCRWAAAPKHDWPTRCSGCWLPDPPRTAASCGTIRR